MNNLIVSGTVVPGLDADLRARAHRAESVMRELPQVEIEIVHHFSQGVYAREMRVPKGVLLTGKIHKYPQLNILSGGEVSVLTHEGPKRIKAPFTMSAPAGVKRVIYAHEDSVWTVIHGTNENDVEKIESEFIAQNEREYLDFERMIVKKDQPCLG